MDRILAGIIENLSGGWLRGFLFIAAANFISTCISSYLSISVDQGPCLRGPGFPSSYAGSVGRPSRWGLMAGSHGRYMTSAPRHRARPRTFSVD